MTGAIPVAAEEDVPALVGLGDVPDAQLCRALLAVALGGQPRARLTWTGAGGEG